MDKEVKKDAISVGFIALGCPKNMVDSERMLAEIGQGGFVLTGEMSQSDVVVINTCGFIGPAKDEAIEAIREAVEQKKAGTVKKVVVAGCLAQRLGEGLFDEVAEIDAVVGLDERDNIGRILREVTADDGRGRKTFLEAESKKCSDDRGRLLIGPAHRAFLRISEGCDRRCSFCTIPSIRGKFRSKPEELVLEEARELVANGAVELSIIAQDSNYYGRDRGLKGGLSKLLKKLDRIDGLKWIRVMYLYPAEVDDRLIETIASCRKVVNYIDMPIQHINDDILKAMRRSDRKAKTVALVEKLREVIPDVVLRTTVIVGYPGETDEQFAELMEFIKWARFDALGCFPFYPEEGTAAAELPGQVDNEVKEARADELMVAQQEIAFAAGRKRVGKRIECLVDEVQADGTGIGRFYGQAPDIDGVCYIERCKAVPGKIVRGRVVEARDYDLVVRANK